MNWNWFPLNAAGAIQSRMHRRASLDSVEIHFKQEFAAEGAINDLSARQAEIMRVVLDNLDD